MIMSSKWKNAEIDRWKPIYQHSWSYRVYKAYDEELNILITSFLYSKGYTYSHLRQDGAVWDSLVKDYMGNTATNNVLTIRQWSKSFNIFENWMRLGFLLSISSYFENYLASIIKESIESDPGLIFGCSHAIDGMYLKKNNIALKKDSISQIIMLCTKGDWCSRITHIKNLYGKIPCILASSVSELNKIRKIRNDVGHAFGRDIERSQNYENFVISPMTVLQVNRFNHYQRLITQIVREFDLYMVQKHIGCYEPLLHYHNMYKKIKDFDKGDKMVFLKKSLGADVNMLMSKQDCRGIIKYYDSL